MGRLEKVRGIKGGACKAGDVVVVVVGGGVKRQQEMIAAITAIFKHAFPLI